MRLAHPSLPDNNVPFRSNALNAGLVDHILGASGETKRSSRIGVSSSASSSLTSSSLEYKADGSHEYLTTPGVRPKNNEQQQQQHQKLPRRPVATRARGSSGVPPRKFELSDLEHMSEKELLQVFYNDPELAEQAAAAASSQQRRSYMKTTATKPQVGSRSSSRKRSRSASRSEYPAHVRDRMDDGVPVVQWVVVLALLGLGLYQLYKLLSLPAPKTHSKSGGGGGGGRTTRGTNSRGKAVSKTLSNSTRANEKKGKKSLQSAAKQKKKSMNGASGSNTTKPDRTNNLTIAPEKNEIESKGKDSAKENKNPAKKKNPADKDVPSEEALPITSKSLVAEDNPPRSREVDGEIGFATIPPLSDIPSPQEAISGDDDDCGWQPVVKRSQKSNAGRSKTNASERPPPSATSDGADKLVTLGQYSAKKATQKVADTQQEETATFGKKSLAEVPPASVKCLSEECVAADKKSTSDTRNSAKAICNTADPDSIRKEESGVKSADAGDRKVKEDVTANDSHHQSGNNDGNFRTTPAKKRDGSQAVDQSTAEPKNQTKMHVASDENKENSDIDTTTTTVANGDSNSETVSTYTTTVDDDGFQPAGKKNKRNKEKTSATDATALFSTSANDGRTTGKQEKSSSEVMPKSPDHVATKTADHVTLDATTCNKSSASDNSSAADERDIKNISFTAKSPASSPNQVDKGPPKGAAGCAGTAASTLNDEECDGKTSVAYLEGDAALARQLQLEEAKREETLPPEEEAAWEMVPTRSKRKGAAAATAKSFLDSRPPFRR